MGLGSFSAYRYPIALASFFEKTSFSTEFPYVPLSKID